MIDYIDGEKLRDMFLAGAKNLERNKHIVDALNVFPIPDGDTGTNMSLTTNAAASVLKSVKETSVDKVAAIISNETTNGSRGNSGVILSRLFFGFSKYVKGLKQLDAEGLGKALRSGVDTAYRAVMKPTEGTILTVAREIADGAINESRRSRDIIQVLESAYKKGEAALARTPELLPVLKQAGVVDAGGRGYLFLIEGAIRLLKGEWSVEDMEEAGLPAPGKKSGEPTDAPGAALTEIPAGRMSADIKYPYCTEFLISKNANASAKRLKEALSFLGDSMLVVDNDETIKVHIHTDHPGKVLEEAVCHGELNRVKIDNMKVQHNRLLEINENALQSQESVAYRNDSQEDSKEKNQDVQENPDKVEAPAPFDESSYGIVAVAAGEGLINLFKSLGAERVVSGGQSMNPSTGDILEAIEKVRAKNVFVLPNNKNIIMAANQAKDISGKNVSVIPSKTILQGLSAIISISPSDDFAQNEKNMLEAIENVKSGQVTFAVRDSNYDGKNISEGDYLGLVDGKITVTGKDMQQVARELLDSMVDEDSSLITIIYGEGVTGDEAKAIAEYASGTYSDCDVEVQEGNQPVYYYLIGVE